MEKEELISRIQEIGICEDDIQRRELLTKLQEDASADYDSISTMSTSLSKLKEDNETLRDANMKLFLRVGEHETTPETRLNNGGNEPPKEKLSFSDLFAESGVLK